jgi:imidazolonepropionase-like amidohydrolase
MKIAPYLASLAAILAVPALAASNQCQVTLKDAHVWANGSFAVRDLSWVGDRFVATPPMDATTIQAGWLWLTPPLADGHTHTVDEPSGQDDAFHNAQVKAGVFYALNPNSILSGKPILSGLGLVEVALAGGGITGPGGHPRPLYEGLARGGRLGKLAIAELAGRAFHEAATPDAARQAVRKVKATGVSFVKLFLLYHDTETSNGLSAENFRAAVAEANKVGLRPIVHVDSAADFRLAVAEKVFAIVHAPGLSMDDDRPDDAYLMTAADARAAKAASITVVPTLAPSFYYTTGTRLARSQRVLGYNLKLMRDAGVKLASGADMYGKSVTDDINLMRGTTLFDGDQLIAISTENGIRMAFPDRKVGKIEPGWEASFVAYYSDPTKIWAVIGDPFIGVREGQVLFDGAHLLPDACASKRP